MSDTSEDLKGTFVRLVIGQVRRKVGGVGVVGVLCAALELRDSMDPRVTVLVAKM